MTAGEATIRVTNAGGDESLGHVRRLFRAFAAEYDPLVAGIFQVQGFADEVAGLLGRYSPPSG